MLYVYYVTRPVRRGGDECVVIAQSEQEAKELAARSGVSSIRYTARLIGTADQKDKEIILSNVWHQ